MVDLDAVIVASTAKDLDDPQSHLLCWIDRVAEKASASGGELAKIATEELIQVAIRFYCGAMMGH